MIKSIKEVVKDSRETVLVDLTSWEEAELQIDDQEKINYLRDLKEITKDFSYIRIDMNYSSTLNKFSNSYQDQANNFTLSININKYFDLRLIDTQLLI